MASRRVGRRGEELRRIVCFFEGGLYVDVYVRMGGGAAN